MEKNVIMINTDTELGRYLTDCYNFPKSNDYRSGDLVARVYPNCWTVVGREGINDQEGDAGTCWPGRFVVGIFKSENDSAIELEKSYELGNPQMWKTKANYTVLTADTTIEMEKGKNEPIRVLKLKEEDRTLLEDCISGAKKAWKNAPVYMNVKTI